MTRTVKTFLFLFFLIGSAQVFADDLNGPTFSMPLISVSGSGGTATSTSYSMAMSAGAPLPNRTAAGPNYSLKSGFFSQFFAPPGPPSNIDTVVPPDTETTITVTGPGGLITVIIPEGTFSDVVTVSVIVPASYPALQSNVAGLTGIGVGVEVTVTPNLTPQQPIIIIMEYLDPQIAGLQENQLRVANFLNPGPLWVPLESSVDATANTITLRAARLGLFQAAQMAAGATINQAFAYPNPFRPSLGHTELRISNIPAEAKVAIFTIRGLFVREIIPDSAGLAVWDGKNRDGEDVASGVYIAQITVGGSRENIRIAVQR